jgi:hypothetical protein
MEAQYAFQGLALPTIASIKFCGKIGHFAVAKERCHEPAHQHFQPDQWQPVFSKSAPYAGLTV